MTLGRDRRRPRPGDPGVLRLLWRLRRTPARVPAPFTIAARSRGTFVARLFFEVALLLSRRVPLDLKELAALRAASLVGCPW